MSAEVRLLSADAYLFDIDGTLLNSGDAVHYDAFHRALRDVFGIEAKIEGVPVHGNTDVGILRAVTRNAGIDEATFQKIAAKAKQDCPLSKALASVPEITLTATLRQEPAGS